MPGLHNSIDWLVFNASISSVSVISWYSNTKNRHP